LKKRRLRLGREQALIKESKTKKLKAQAKKEET